MSNRGLLTTNQQGHLNNDGNVWYHTKAISNILSMRKINKNNCIIYEYNNGEKFKVINTRTGGHRMIFTSKND